MFITFEILIFILQKNAWIFYRRPLFTPESRARHVLLRRALYFMSSERLTKNTLLPHCKAWRGQDNFLYNSDWISQEPFKVILSFLPVVFIQSDLQYIYNRHCLSGASSSCWWRQCSYFGHFSPFLKYFSLYSLFCAALKNIESNNLIYIYLMYQYNNTINNNYNILIWSCGVVLCANACYSEHCFSLVTVNKSTKDMLHMKWDLSSSGLC